MSHRDEGSKHMLLWGSVFLATAVIFIGWLFSLKYNFAKTNAELNSGQSSEAVATEVQTMFNDFGEVMDQQEKLRLANLPDDSPEKKLQQQLNTLTDDIVNETPVTLPLAEPTAPAEKVLKHSMTLWVFLLWVVQKTLINLKQLPSTFSSL